MAQEVAITKRLKIDKAQQWMMIEVLGASLIVGVAIVLSLHFFKIISFNNKVIAAKDEAISHYSDTIKFAGVCRSPSGSTYTEAELEKCDPSSIMAESIPGTLRSNVLLMAANANLESVGREYQSSDCFDAEGNKYTYDQLNQRYENAETDEARSLALGIIKICSALRVIPDALPAQKNEEALMSSLNQIFILSDWEPEALSASGTSNESPIAGLGTIPLAVSVEASSQTTRRVLANIERSIREFNFTSAKIEWSADDQLDLRAQANAYYIDTITVNEKTKTIKASGK